MSHPLSAPGGVGRNRLRAVLLHVPWYTVDCGARLAADAGCSPSTISRVIHHKLTPTPDLASRICQAVSRRSGIDLPVGEIFTDDGFYPTGSTCVLMDCASCLPPWAWNERTHRLKARWRHAPPSHWCFYPQRPVAPTETLLTPNTSL